MVENDTTNEFRETSSNRSKTPRRGVLKLLTLPARRLKELHASRNTTMTCNKEGSTTRVSWVPRQGRVGERRKRGHCGFALCVVTVLTGASLLSIAGCFQSNRKEVVVYAALDREFSEPVLKDF